MLYTNNQLKFYLTEELPVVLSPAGRPVFLSDIHIDILKICRDGESKDKITEYIRERNAGADPVRLVECMVGEGLLLEKRPGLRWKGNTFGSWLIGEEEANATTGVFRTRRLFRHEDIALDDLYSGSRSPCLEFERTLASLVGVRHCIALNSGTSALECALGAAGIGPGHRVIVPAFAFIGVVSAVMNAGATPTICDIDNSLMLSPEAVGNSITDDTRAIICVHIRGFPAKIDELKKVADAHGLMLIEDCAQSFGTTFLGKSVGSYGDIGCLSFHQHKIITCGEGGAVVTERDDIHKKILIMSDSSRLFAHRELLPGVPGHNYRMSELHAAVGIEQLKRLPRMAVYLRRLYGGFAELLNAIEGVTVQEVSDREGAVPQAAYFMVETAGMARAVARDLVRNGVPASVLYSEGVINHDVYVCWPYVLESINVVDRWDPTDRSVLELCPATLDILSRTIKISLGMEVTESDISEASDVIAGTLQR